MGNTPSRRQHRPHWHKDKDHHRCRRCCKDFSFFHRRHHCRDCGGVVCAECSSHTKLVDGYDDEMVRVCDSCYYRTDHDHDDNDDDTDSDDSMIHVDRRRTQRPLFPSNNHRHPRIAQELMAHVEELHLLALLAAVLRGGNDGDDDKHPATTEELDSMTKTTMPSTASSDDEDLGCCCICQENFCDDSNNSNNEVFVMKTCKHIFHYECAKDLFKIDKKCPVCRDTDVL